MSINDEIEKYCTNEAHELRLHVPMRPSFVVQRHIFLAKEVQGFVDFEEGTPVQFETISGRAVSRLDSISNGCYVTFGMNPHDKKATCLIARVGPVELGIVDVRLTDPKPAVRIFGAFAATDILVLLRWAPRDDLQFAELAAQCRGIWDSMFPNFPPLISDKVEDYVSKHFHIG